MTSAEAPGSPDTTAATILAAALVPMITSYARRAAAKEDIERTFRNNYGGEYMSKEMKIEWLDGPPTNVYRKIAKAAINCHSENPKEDFAKLDSTAPVEMFGKRFVDGIDAAKWLVAHVKKMGHWSVLEFSGQWNFIVTGISRGLTHEQVRSRIGASYAQRSTRYVAGGDYIKPPQLDARLGELFDDLQGHIRIVRDEIDDVCGREVSRYLHTIAAEAPTVIGFNNLRSFLYFLKLRCCNRAHFEIREMANQMKAMAAKEYPDIFKDSGAPCVSLEYCPEAGGQCEELAGKIPTHSDVMNGFRKSGWPVWGGERNISCPDCCGTNWTEPESGGCSSIICCKDCGSRFSYSVYGGIGKKLD